jgi:hypothetical protein
MHVSETGGRGCARPRAMAVQSSTYKIFATNLWKKKAESGGYTYMLSKGMHNPDWGAVRPADWRLCSTHKEHLEQIAV